jgi:hypothetical protein
MRRRFKSDPKWIISRYPARCAKPDCEVPITPGERAFYDPEDRSLYGSRCRHGEEAARDFNAQCVDEDGY